MTRYEKFIACAYAALYAFGIWVVCMDLYVWRADEPRLSGAQIQAAEQAKKYFAKGGDQ